MTIQCADDLRARIRDLAADEPNPAVITDRILRALHAVECRRCGPSGKPAPAGSPISAGHQHARALRVVAKEVLKDLWREAKRIHEGSNA